MGIKGLTQLVKKNSPDSITHKGLYTMKDKRIAIDTSIFLYKSLMNVRSKGDYLRNSEGKVVSHIQGLYYKTNQLLTFGITPIYIFDGKPPEEKSDCIKERNKKANECKEKMENTENPEEKKALEKGTIRIKKEYIDDLKHMFGLMGVSYIHADGEAEAYASELCRLGFVDAVMTEDMDTLSYGCPQLFRTCIDKSIKRPDIVTVFNFEKILMDFKMNHDEFIDMCILCGCDYCCGCGCDYCCDYCCGCGCGCCPQVLHHAVAVRRAVSAVLRRCCRPIRRSNRVGAETPAAVIH